jgi:hypothetical protein
MDNQKGEKMCDGIRPRNHETFKYKYCPLRAKRDKGTYSYVCPQYDNGQQAPAKGCAYKKQEERPAWQVE